jgi:hypothetical protein
LANLITALEEKGHAIEEEARARQSKEASAALNGPTQEGETLTPDEVIPPGQARPPTET